MKVLTALVRRNCKLFFKDKGMFFTAIITPLILLVLYATFLANIYSDAFTMSIPEGFSVESKLIDSAVGGQLVSSLLAVCCVTVAFSSCLIMVQDKISGAYTDITVSPVKKTTLSLGYFISTAISTLIICAVATAAGLIYITFKGWYYNFADILKICGDVLLLVLFGTAFASAVCFPLTSQGQCQAVGTIISAGYGFICGAYMPISNFSTGLQHVLSFLPGTYGTSLVRNHAMSGALRGMEESGLPKEVTDRIRDSIDCNIYFFDKKVSVGIMYIVLAASTVLLISLYVIMNKYITRKDK